MCICPLVICCVHENTKNRDSACWAITKFDWQFGRYEPSSLSTKELHGCWVYVTERCFRSNCTSPYISSSRRIWISLQRGQILLVRERERERERERGHNYFLPPTDPNFYWSHSDHPSSHPSIWMSINKSINVNWKWQNPRRSFFLSLALIEFVGSCVVLCFVAAHTSVILNKDVCAFE